MRVRLHTWPLALLLLLVASCADQTPTEPRTRMARSAAEEVEPTKLDQLARYRTGPLQITIGLALKTIGPEGGSLALGGFEVIIPPGAVSKATRFSIRLPVDPHNSEFVRAHFGPSMSFALPVTVRLPLKGTTAEGYSAHVLWWNGTDWIAYPTIMTADGRIETQTTHFSEYGTEEPSKGIILVGGGR